ncbi:hypothetical protein [Sandaracinus amylolyticus]|uniref:Uncharacterized protein n=1 Tax=Sandaracinus amylolyticus TaxID=927083 RepID=A0A0F6SDG4_9BACT|nr:hypothetical protein [Sandaracinus amylolyticus]AKF03399.1 hypothetical protein DB32_000548 [Sandaracinus amylolyticus]
MTYCVWTKSSRATKKKSVRCGLSKAEARAALKRAFAAGKKVGTAGMYRKKGR